MKTFYFAAALLMASTAAHAGNGISFQINGQKVHIEAPRNCEALSCVQITTPGMSGNLKSFTSKLGGGDDNGTTDSNPPAQKTAPDAPAQAPQAQGPQIKAPEIKAPAVEASPAPGLLHDVTPSSSTSAPPTVSSPVAAELGPAAAATPAAQPAADAQASPIGLWQTQDDKGNVQIEQCGPNLCGYSEKTREPILINMKPSNNKWTGRIHDPEGGSNYDSTIAMKGPNLLKVQGCALGGLFCGGQTWKRIS